MRSYSPFFFTLLLLGCAEDPGRLDAAAGDAATVDAARPDAAALDAGGPDATSADAEARDGSGLDAEAADAEAADAEAADAEATDAEATDAEVTDAGSPDAGSPDAGTCDYLDLDICVLDCGGLVYGRGFRDLQGMCPDFFRLRGHDYPDVAAALVGESCNTACIWKAAISVSFIDHCGRRNGYIVFEAPGEGCADLYEFSSGLYMSVADWQAVTPC